MTNPGKPGRKAANSVDSLTPEQQVQFHGRLAVLRSGSIAAAGLINQFVIFIASDHDRFKALLVEWVKSERAS